MRKYYTANSRFKPSAPSSRFSPALIVIAVLLAAILILQLSGAVNIGGKGATASLKSTIHREIKSASNMVDSLSNLGGSDSYQKLEYIRQYIHGVELINEISKTIYGASWVSISQTYFDDIYSIIGDYTTKLISGQKVTEVLNDLRIAVDSLQSVISSML